MGGIREEIAKALAHHIAAVVVRRVSVSPNVSTVGVGVQVLSTTKPGWSTCNTHNGGMPVEVLICPAEMGAHCLQLPTERQPANRGEHPEG